MKLIELATKINSESISRFLQVSTPISTKAALNTLELAVALLLIEQKNKQNSHLSRNDCVIVRFAPKRVVRHALSTENLPIVNTYRTKL